MKHLGKLISLFYKKHSNKPTTTSESIYIVIPIAKLTISLTIKPKKKQNCSIKNISKRARRNWVWFFWRFWTFLSYQKKKLVNNHFNPWNFSLLYIKEW